MKQILAIALGLAVACVLCEVVVLVFFGEQAKFPRHVVEAAWGLRYNEPGATFRHKSADVDITFRINHQGMRADRDYAHEKPAGVSRIVSLGDSFTLGYEVELDECFSSVIERELNKAGLSVEVLNAGVSGFSTAEECLYLERELIRYEPDLVLVSFYGNDLRDNVRCGLFKLADGELVSLRDRYVPAGGIGNFLNTNPFFNLLSERSNAFVFAKERATLAAKTMMVRREEGRYEEPAAEQAPGSAHAAGSGQDGSEAGTADGEEPEIEYEYHKRLTAAILDRLYAFVHARGIPLIIQSIPEVTEPGAPLRDDFPHEFFTLDRPGLFFVDTGKLLEPYYGRTPLYHWRSHHHWTPRSHELSGMAVAALVLEHDLLGAKH